MELLFTGYELTKIIFILSILFNLIAYIYFKIYVRSKRDYLGLALLLLSVGIFQEYYLHTIPTGYLYFFINVIYNVSIFNTKVNTILKKVKPIILVFIVVSFFIHKNIIALVLISSIIKIYLIILAEIYKIKLRTITSTFVLLTIVNYGRLLDEFNSLTLHFVVLDAILNLFASFFLIRNGITNFKITNILRK